MKSPTNQLMLIPSSALKTGLNDFGSETEITLPFINNNTTGLFDCQSSLKCTIDNTSIVEYLALAGANAENQVPFGRTQLRNTHKTSKKAPKTLTKRPKWLTTRFLHGGKRSCNRCLKRSKWLSVFWVTNGRIK